MEVTPDTHYLCVDDGNNLIVNENQEIMFQHKTTGSVVYETLTSELDEMFGILQTHSIANIPAAQANSNANILATGANSIANISATRANSTASIPAAQANKENKKVCWTRAATLNLIELYKTHQKDFESNTIKKDTIWNEIAIALRSNGYSYTPNQCSDKFKYLKLNYTKKKDNMGQKSSGAATVKFDFLDEMDEIFGKKPFVKPVSIASSSRAVAMESPKKKKRKHVLEEFLDIERENQNQRERRHKERLEMQQNAIAAFQSSMSNMIDLVKKN